MAMLLRTEHRNGPAQDAGKVTAECEASPQGLKPNSSSAPIGASELAPFPSVLHFDFSVAFAAIRLASAGGPFDSLRQAPSTPTQNHLRLF